MPLKLEDKQAIVASVNEIAKNSSSAIVAEYRGISVDDMTELRKQAREAGVYLRVVRNTLARRAVTNTDFECLTEILVGPILLAFSREEPSAAAKVLNDFIKSQDKLVVKGIGLGKQLLEASALSKVAKLPTYLESISLLMSVMQAPITKMVRTIAEPQAQLVRTLAAIADQPQSEQ
jgi:large subunit ribosomal protein L10